jgi:pimeloyl-ACP methyl ester carboxylesterase
MFHFALTLLFITWISTPWLLANAASLQVLSPKWVEWTKTAVDLSNQAYDIVPSGIGYAKFELYGSGPDQSIVARTEDGYCFGVFRGTAILDVTDWWQNFELGTQNVCPTTDNANDCCTARIGYYQGYYNGCQADFEGALRECAALCTDPDECVILTGHSQGGAIANVAAVALADLKPYVITFGQPPAIEGPCSAIISDRWIRYVNTMTSGDSALPLIYDPIPFAPNLGADFFGYYIVVTDDGVVFVGNDPGKLSASASALGLPSHFITEYPGFPTPGYVQRIHAAFDDNTAIDPNGLLSASLCSENSQCQSNVCSSDTSAGNSYCQDKGCSIDSDCDTGRCDSGVCLPKLASCQKCNEHSDCMSNLCSWNNQCTNMDGLVDDNCACNLNSDCASGRCRGFFNRTCRPRMNRFSKGATD